jgi:hypothetical protein
MPVPIGPAPRPPRPVGIGDVFRDIWKFGLRPGIIQAAPVIVGAHLKDRLMPRPHPGHPPILEPPITPPVAVPPALPVAPPPAVIPTWAIILFIAAAVLIVVFFIIPKGKPIPALA